jgi:hypothetical protein
MKFIRTNKIIGIHSFVFFGAKYIVIGLLPCKISQLEINSVILHEIGHFRYAHHKVRHRSLKQELEADNYVATKGYAKYLISYLICFLRSGYCRNKYEIRTRIWQLINYTATHKDMYG